MKRYRLRNLRLTRVDRVPAGSNPESHIVLFKTADEYPTSDVTVTDTQDPEVSVDEVTEETPEETAEIDEAPEAPAEILEDVTEPVTAEETIDAPVAAEPELVAASADPVEKAEMVSLQKQLDDARTELAKMKRDARTAEFVAKARTDLANVGNADEIGGLLLDAADSLPAESYQLLERTLKALNAQVEAGGIFTQIGKSDAEPAAAQDKITALAQAMVEKGEAANLGLAKMAVVKQHPELRDEYYSATERA